MRALSTEHEIPWCVRRLEDCASKSASLERVSNNSKFASILIMSLVIANRNIAPEEQVLLSRSMASLPCYES